MKRSLRTLLLALSLTTATLTPTATVAAPPPIRLVVSPAVGLWPDYNPVARIDLEKSPAGAALCLEADGPTYQSSCWEIVQPRGAQPPSHYERRLMGLQPGRYVVSATVARVDRTTKTVSITIRVVGIGEDGEP